MATRKKTPRRYADGTKVSVESSRAELERLLDAHGATHFGVYREPTRTVVMWKLGERFVKQVVTAPGEPMRTQGAELRRRWRVLVLLTKAKLEVIAGGDSTVEREFLADTMLADGSTVFEATSTQLAESYASGQMPRFLLGAGGA